MAARIFVSLEPRLWKRSTPDLRAVGEGPRPDDFKYAPRDAYVEDFDRAAMQTARQQQVPGLTPEERHGPGGPDGTPHHRAVRSIDPARQGDRDDGYTRAGYGVDHGGRQPFDLAIEARAEQGIDDQVTVRKPGRGCPFDLSVPFFCRARGIPVKPLSVADKAHAYTIAPVRQKTARHKSVAAIIAGPCHHNNPSTPHGSARHVSHRKSGVLHQLEARDTTSNRQAIGFCHFVGREQLVHRCRTYRWGKRANDSY